MDADIIGNARLEAFAARSRAAGRILYGDVCRLQRNVLANGIATREQVRLLLDLDRAIPRADRAFGQFLVASVVSFVVWGERPTGRVDEDVADWLIDCLCSERLTRNGIAIVAEILEEADNAPPALRTLLDQRRTVHHDDAARVPGVSGDAAVAQAA